VGNVIGYAKYGALGLGSLLFLFFVTRHLRRREQAVLVGEPTWLSQIDAPRPVGQLAAGASGGGAMNAGATEPMLTSNPNRRRQQIEQALQREPDRVVQTLRGWMAEEEAT
jgi:flagellar M-ring protein FliF